MRGKVTEVTIGGEVHRIPQLSFARLELIWPVLEEMQGVENPLESGIAASEQVRRRNGRTNCIIRIFSIALERSKPELTPEEIRERLFHNEVVPLLNAFGDLMENAGLSQGEAQPSTGPLAQVNGSTETSAESSQSSLH